MAVERGVRMNAIGGMVNALATSMDWPARISVLICARHMA
jgi:hypothetical protein